MIKEIEVGLGETKIGWEVSHKHGFTVIARSKTKRNRAPAGKTARHEIKHLLPAIIRGIDGKATITPGPGYLGKTELESFDPVAAIAPDADGEDGTGFDVFLVEKSGHDRGAAAAEARRILAENNYLIEPLAEELQASGTITGADAKVVIERENNPEAEIEIFGLLGEKRQFIQKTRRVPGRRLTYLIPLEIPDHVEKEKPKEAKEEKKITSIDDYRNNRPFKDKLNQDLSLAA